jgi:HD-GYP domain-containing protein (c-di-GMP phosphodiesterase class II)
MEQSLTIVAVKDLKIGMFVAEPDCPWMELSFPLQGFVISDPREIEEFAKHCRMVYVDNSFSVGEYHRAPVRQRDKPLQSAAFEQAPVSNEAKKRQERRKRFLQFLYDQDKSPRARAFSEELAYIEPRFDNVQVSLRQTLDSLRVEEKVDFRNVSEKLGELSGSLERNPDAVMWLMRLKRADMLSFDQAMDVSIYLLLLGKHVGLAGEQLIQLSMAGMLQDIGKTALPPELLIKKGALSDQEKDLVRSHVASSLELLCLQHSLPPEMLMIVANHHERWDGSGYPRGLKTRAIGREAEMAGLVDSFCAMLKAKPYRAAKSHQEALEELYKLRNSQFNPALMEQLVQCVGLYPIGTLLELNTGEVGVVIEQNRVQRSRPRLLVLLDAQKRKTRDYHIVDLREARYKAHTVLRSLPQDAYGLDAQDYYLG